MSAQPSLVERTQGATDARLETACGRVIELPVERWWAHPSPEEAPVLDLALSATLDVGCGPGRHVIDLLGRGVAAVGIDNARGAVEAARRRGAEVLQRSIFDRIPNEGRWGTTLLMDGNVGIGGDPDRLLRRCRRLLREGGRALVELSAPGERTGSLKVRAAWANARTDWFPWACVSADHVEPIADACGFDTVQVWGSSGRWFARLDAR